MRNKRSTQFILTQTDRMLKLEEYIQALRIQNNEQYTIISNLKEENSEKVELIKSLSTDYVNLKHKIEELNMKIKDDEVSLGTIDFRFGSQSR